MLTVGTDGSDLRCLTFGFLSHFDWKDNDSIFIWGRAASSLDSMRSNPLFSNPFVKPFLSFAKAVAKNIEEKSNF